MYTSPAELPIRSDSPAYPMSVETSLIHMVHCVVFSFLPPLALLLLLVGCGRRCCNHVSSIILLDASSSVRLEGTSKVGSLVGSHWTGCLKTEYPLDPARFSGLLLYKRHDGNEHDET